MLDPIIPMQPVEVDEPFDDPNCLYQIKWDGVRVLSYLDETGLRLINRRLNHRTEIYPELQALKSQLNARSAILDGEIVAMGEDGKPSFSKILSRDLVKAGDKVRLLVNSIPVYYMIFDILYVNEKWLVDEPLINRQETLASILTESDRIKLVTSQSSGTALFDVMKQQGMEGIVAKEKNGRYHIGQRNPTWKKIKYFRTVYAVVGGVTLKGGQVNSLILGLYHEGELICIGKAGSGLSGADLQALTQFARQLPEQPCPFARKPKFDRVNHDEIVWFPTHLVVEVQYHEWTADMTLRAPTIQGFRERDPASCVL